MDEAQKACAKGNSPFGAVLADPAGTIIDTAHNTSHTDIDPTAHAEINLIRKVSRSLQTKDLSPYTLISNAQSCSMCFSAAIKANIQHFIFGADSESSMDPNLNVFEISKFSQNTLDIEISTLQAKCKEQITQARTQKNPLD